MDMYCALIENEADYNQTLVFSQSLDFFTREEVRLVSWIIEYVIRDFDELKKLAHSVRNGSTDPAFPGVFKPKDGCITIHQRPELGILDPGYDYCLLKYWFPKGDEERVLRGFGVTR